MLKIDGLPYWRLSGCYFLIFVVMGGLMPYWPLYLKSIGFNEKAVGMLFATIVVTKIFSSLIWGWVVDRTGRRTQVICYTLFFSAVSFSLVLFYQDFWSLCAILFLFSVFWSATLPQLEALTLSHLGQHSDRYTTIRIWGSIGFICSVLVFGQLFDAKPINLLLPILVGLMSLVWIHSLSIDEDISSVCQKKYRDSFKSVIAKKYVIALLAVCFLAQASHGPYYAFFSLYLEEQGYTKRFIGTAWSLGVLAEVIIYVFIHRTITRYNLRILMLTALALTTLRWLLIALLVDQVLSLYIAQCLHAASFGLYHAVAIQYIHQEFEGQHQGRGQALYSSISFGAGLSLGSFLSGYVWEYIGSMQIFLMAALMSFAGMMIAWSGLKK